MFLKRLTTQQAFHVQCPIKLPLEKESKACGVLALKGWEVDFKEAK